ncbi:MAG: SDR family oxidoreductase [Myxococcales bacterium]|nr:SDR family oxidoreductase [Myxococcales bacterium]
MSTIAITGAASGIGLATRKLLEASGHRVIGVDLRDVEVVADLATPAGRATMVDGVSLACDGVLDGLVAAAGLFSSYPAELVVSVNYFGAVATLNDLRPLLAKGESPSAVAISSNSTIVTPPLPDVTSCCLADDEDGARVAAEKGGSDLTYPASKLALARWVRRNAVEPDWIGEGIRLNAVAPGLISTPMTAEAEARILAVGDRFPVPMARAGTADEVAGLLAYLLSPEASFFCGSVVFMDGGTEAALRGEDWPAPLSA